MTPTQRILSKLPDAEKNRQGLVGPMPGDTKTGGRV